jgi:hypothetical protein
MSRQSKHKHRITALMLDQIRAQQHLSSLIQRASEAYRRMSAAMAEAYAKARADRQAA